MVNRYAGIGEERTVDYSPHRQGKGPPIVITQDEFWLDDYPLEGTSGENGTREVVHAQIQYRNMPQDTSFTIVFQFLDPAGDEVFRYVHQGNTNQYYGYAVWAYIGRFDSEIREEGGKYKVLIHDSLGGSMREVYSKEFTVHPATNACEGPAAEISLMDPVISGRHVSLNGVVKNNDGVPHVSWGDGVEENSWFPIEHDYAADGTYQVVASVKGLDCQTREATKDIMIGEGFPKVDVLELTAPDSILSGEILEVSGKIRNIGGQGRCYILLELLDEQDNEIDHELEEIDMGPGSEYPHSASFTLPESYGASFTQDTCKVSCKGGHRE